MAITTINSVQVPEHAYPHVEVNINDNSIRKYVSTVDEYCKTLCVFMSPRGRDGIQTITGGIQEFTQKYGNGSFADYGQAFLNARALAATNCITMHCIRVTAPDATFANLHIFMRYKVETEYVAPVNPNDKTDKGTVGKLKVYFVPKYDNNLKDINALVTNPTAPQVEELEDGWKEIRVFSVSSLGKGKYSNGLSVRLYSNSRYDKTNDFKNYTFDVWDSGSKIEEFRVCLSDEAIINNKSYYMPNIINEDGYGSGSDNIVIDLNEDFLPIIYATYKEKINPLTSLTEYDFDPLLGIDKTKTTKIRYGVVNANTSIDGFEFDTETEGSIQFNTETGTSLTNGGDGSFARGTDTKVKETAIKSAFLKVFNGTEISDASTGETKYTGYAYEDILSKNKYPIDFFLDAHYPEVVKNAICGWAARRKEDFMVYLDNGTSDTIVTKTDAYTTTEQYDDLTNHWNFSIDSYYGKIKDPYNYKIIEVTSTYNLARVLPLHWKNHDGKHIPYAGTTYGTINTYLPNSVFPLMDEALDSDHMDAFVAEHINFAQINSRGDVIRATQTTRYPTLGDPNTISNLSEINNCHIVLDIKKDCEKLLESFLFDFNEESDLIRFNRSAEIITQKYADAQVKSITASFDRTEEEAEYGILHLYITLQHKSLVKVAIVDIDVNRSVSSTD